MLDWIALTALVAAVIVLIALSKIDLAVRLLPNELVLSFFTLGCIFHLSTLAAYVSPTDMAAGGALGFGSLYVLRMIANRHYGEDALGLGDVKLMGAAGIWLGPQGLALAMLAGAIAAMLHGVYEAFRIARKTKSKPYFSRLQIPAGPGFAVGIILAGIWMFRTFNPLTQ